MKKRTIAICDRNERFVRKFSEYLASQETFPLEVAAFSDPGALQAAKFSEPPELILVSEELAPLAAGCSSAAKVCLLCDEREPEEEERIWRFQSRDALMEDLLRQLPETAVPVPASLAFFGTELLGVWSPLGRCGKTFFAVTLGEILAERNRTLYINMEDHPALSLLGEDGWHMDLSDLIYQYRIAPDKVMAKLPHCVRHFDRLEYIPPAFSSGDLAGISGEEWSGFLSLLSEEGGYASIILDLGSRAGAVPEITGLCSRLYVPVLDDPVSAAKLARFREMAEEDVRQPFADRITYVHVPELPAGSLPVTGEQLSRGRIGSYIRRRIRNGRAVPEKEW